VEDVTGFALPADMNELGRSTKPDFGAVASVTFVSLEAESECPKIT
jgi:hypothetical protein